MAKKKEKAADKVKFRKPDSKNDLKNNDKNANAIDRSDDEESILQSQIKKTISQTFHVPDGGYGWVIVLSGLIISFIVDGVTYTFGVFLGKFEEAFQQPKSVIALASSLQVGVYLMVGPIVSVLTNRFGCRPVIIVGSLIASAAFIGSAFSNNVTTLIVVYGFIGGFGFGMMYLPSVVAVSIYFESKRALATGICVCGSGIGTFVLAPVSELLLNEYNWSWALLILGAIILNGVVFGGLVRPLELIPSTKIITQENGDASKGKKKKSVEDSKELVPLITVTDDKEETTVMFKNAAKDTSKINPAEPVDTETPLNVKNDDGKNNRKNSAPSVTIEMDEIMPRMRSNTFDVSQPQQSSDSAEPISKSQTGLNKSLTSGLNKSHNSGINKSHMSIHSNKSQSHAPLGLAFVSMSDVQLNKIRDEVHLPIARKDIHLAGSLAEPEWDYSKSPEGQQPLDFVVQSIESLSSVGSRKGIWACLPDSARETIEEMLSLSILKDKRYWFVLAGNFSCMIGFYVPFVYVPERATLLGIEKEQAAFLLSIIGITNLVGRVLTGIVITFSRIDPILVTIVALIICGIMTIVCPFCYSFGALAAVSAIFGLGVAAYISMCSILLCELLGVNKLTNAFGFVILFRGIACIIGPPMAGAIIDSTGVFDEAFFVGGAFIVLGGLWHLMLYAPCYRKKSED
ncbi:monocarboxylate transporter 7 [Biomphalaria glabrata]|nr:monocarboxylate transporter 7-like [Biomphalaria glabrata]